MGKESYFKQIELPVSGRKEAILAEYNQTRNELLELNKQIFSLFAVGLVAEITVLGWMFSKDPNQSWYLPFVATFALLLVNISTLNISRLAHRLAFFQKYFIEKRLSEICWGRVYSAFRSSYPQNKNKWNIERIAEIRQGMNVAMQVINFVLIVKFGLYNNPLSCQFKILIIFGYIAILLFQGWLKKYTTDYREMDEIMRNGFAQVQWIDTGERE